MGRNSKQAGGNFPLTHYERTKIFVSSEYGTTQQRLAGYSQYQLGYCALTISRIIDTDTDSSTTDSTTTESNTSIAMCTPSGYLYCKQAILEYLLVKTSEYNDTIRLYEATIIQQQQQNTDSIISKKRQQEELLFNTSQQLVVSTNSSNKKIKSNTNDDQQTNLVVYNNNDNDKKTNDKNDLQRTSYWLPSSSSSLSNPNNDKESQQRPQPQRPSSPCTGQCPLRRKDIWPVRLQWNNTNTNTNTNTSTSTSSDMYVCCAISDKRIQTQSAIAYWTIDTKKITKKTNTTSSTKTTTSSSTPILPGIIVLESIYNELIQPTMICPLTNKVIYTTRLIQLSGTSYASSQQGCTGTQYRPTIT